MRAIDAKRGGSLVNGYFFANNVVSETSLGRKLYEGVEKMYPYTPPQFCGGSENLAKIL